MGAYLLRAWLPCQLLSSAGLPAGQNVLTQQLNVPALQSVSPALHLAEEGEDSSTCIYTHGRYMYMALLIP